MNALLVVAHGSRRRQSNDEVRELARKLLAQCTGEYPVVETAFLELAEPSIPQGIARCLEQGADNIIVLPYFLNSGTHVMKDIPDIVDRERARYSHVTIQIARHLGASERMLDLLIDTAHSTGAG